MHVTVSNGLHRLTQSTASIVQANSNTAPAPAPAILATSMEQKYSQDSQVYKMLQHVGVVFTTTPAAMLGDNPIEKQLSDKATRFVALQVCRIDSS